MNRSTVILNIVSPEAEVDCCRIRVGELCDVATFSEV